MSKTMVVDLNNLAFVTRFLVLGKPKSSRQKEKNAELTIFLSLVQYIARGARENDCDGILIACDGRKIWRRGIYPDYKVTSTTDEDPYYKEVLWAADKAKQFFRDHTGAMVIDVERCEADDIIGIWCSNHQGKSLIFSTDGDYIQLLSDKVELYSPTKKIFIEEDPSWNLFLKCIRGDKSDAIRSAYPRVRVARLEKAWRDPIEMLDLMETVRKDGKKVGDVFDFNLKLMDLSAQPEEIKETVLLNMRNYENNRYSDIGVIRFFGEVGLKDRHSTVPRHKSVTNVTRLEEK